MNASCVLYAADGGDRFGCWHWPTFHSSREATLQSDLSPSSLRWLRRVFSRRSVYFVGDSLTGQHFRSFACAMQQESSVPSGTIPDATCVARNRDPTRNETLISARSCWLRAGDGIKDITLKGQLLYVLSSLQRGDVVVLNQGVWWRQRDTEASVELLYLKKGLTSAHVKRLRDRFFHPQTSCDSED